MRHLWATVGCLLIAGCVSTDSPQPTQTPTEVATVTVTQGPITSVLVVAGQVSASPVFVIEAPAAGQVVWADEIAPDAAVTSEPLGTAGDEPVISPAPGRLLELLTPSDTAVAARIPVATVAYQGFGIQAVVPVAEQYRLYDGTLSGRASIEGGPGGVDCQPVPIPTEGQEDTAGVPVTCLLPLDTPVVAGLSAKVGLATGAKESALLLPVSAVSGRTGSGEVTVVAPDGSHQRQQVTLGMTDGANIEIVDGLSEGDVVLAAAPTLR